MVSLIFHILDKNALTNRLSEATGKISWPQAEAWGLDTITALRAENLFQKMAQIADLPIKNLTCINEKICDETT